MNLGVPQINNYSKDDYEAGSQNWATIWNNGRQYFANNGGLLEYDGHNWDVHPTTNNTILRCLISKGPDTIYIGAQEEIGYFSPNEQGMLAYTSIIPSLQLENENLEEIWDMELIGADLYIKIKYNEILIHNPSKQKTITTEAFITKLAKAGEEVWYHVQDKGLYRIAGYNSQFIEGSEFLKQNQIIDFLHEPMLGTFILTEKKGIYLYQDGRFKKWQSNSNDYLIKHRISCGLLSNKGELILGTFTGGILISSVSGQTRQLLLKKNGLQNNNITALSLSPNNELWIGTGNGIDRIHLNGNKETFYPDGDLEGGVYDIEKWDDKIFFSTTNGVYFIEEKEYYNPFSELAYTFVPGTEGQAWGFDEINGELFCGHSMGGFRINKDLSLDYLQRTSGAWKFISLDDKTIAVGGYNGVTIIKQKGNKWVTDHKVPGLNISSRVMLLDKDHNLWVSHPYKNLYKISFNQDYTYSSIKAYDSRDGFYTDQRNYAFYVNGNCVITNETGIYEYVAETDNFRPAEELTKLYGEGVHVKTIISDKDNLWTISSEGTDRITYTDDDLPQRHNFGIDERDAHYIGGFENLFPLSDSLLLICSDKGVHKVKARAGLPPLQSPTLTAVSLIANGDSLLYGGHGSYIAPSLREEENAIRFDYSSLNTLDPKRKFFRYFLEGLDQEWSPWTLAHTKEYNNLNSGAYNFLVRTINSDGSEGPITSFPFKIDTPWYKTVVSKILLVLLGILAVLFLYLVPNKKLQETTAQLEAERHDAEEETRKLKKEAELEAEKLRKEAEVENQRLKAEAQEKARQQQQEADTKLELLKREKLQNEIEFKNKELAMSTMILLQKNETIKAIRGEIEQAEKNIKDPVAKKELKKVVSLLRSDDRMEDDWNNFSIHFDQAHHQFLKRIKEAYPKLTPKDQKLCAYLRMNLSTKEIAPLLKISVRGVEISRYRLRKKIGLDKKHNLNEFMMGF